MTNPNVPNYSPPSGGGMPKWLILVLVVFLIIVLGCCGGFAACHWACQRVVSTAAQAAKDNEARLAKQLQEAAAERQAAAQREAQGVGGNGGGPGGGGGAGNDVGNPLNRPGGEGENATPPGPGAHPEAQVVTSSLPENFPSDIPTYKGLKPFNSGSDNLKGSGAVEYMGTGDHKEVKDFYRSEMKKQGWSATEDSDVGQLSSLVFEKDGRTATILIASDPQNGNQLMVTVSYGKK